MVAAQAGIEVVLIDRDQESAARGKARGDHILKTSIKRGKITSETKAEILDRITATSEIRALRGCDLVIEAVAGAIKSEQASGRLAEMLSVRKASLRE